MIEHELHLDKLGVDYGLSLRHTVETVIAKGRGKVQDDVIDADTIARGLQHFDDLYTDDRRAIRNAIFNLYGFERSVKLDAICVTPEVFDGMANQDFFPFLPAVYRNSGHMPMVYVMQADSPLVLRYTPEFEQ